MVDLGLEEEATMAEYTSVRPTGHSSRAHPRTIRRLSWPDWREIIGGRERTIVRSCPSLVDELGEARLLLQIENEDRHREADRCLAIRSIGGYPLLLCRFLQPDRPRRPRQP
jgi:hypothetical protein